MASNIDQYLRSLPEFFRSLPQTLGALPKKLEVNYPLTYMMDWRITVFVRMVSIVIIALFLFATIIHITKDPPTNMSWDGALYTDEGFYSSDAIQWFYTGVWFKEGRYNQFINLPILQFIQAFGFWITGSVNLLTVRMINWIFMVLWLGSCYLLYRKLIGPRWALLGLAMLCVNHIVYGMSRFALAEIPMAFMVTAAFVCALYAQGGWRYPLSALSAALYSLAILTKTNAVFVAPILALTTILVEPKPKVVFFKFILCSSIFFAFMGAYYKLLIEPYRLQFDYFYRLNISIARISDITNLGEWKQKFDFVWELFTFGDRILITPLPYFTIIALLFVRKTRPLPLLWLSIGWLFFFLMMYSYYGRIYPRFFMVAMPAVVGIYLTMMQGFWSIRHRFSYLLGVGALVLVASTAFNLYQIAGHMIKISDSYNEMARDVEKILDEDPTGNRKIIGHPACSLTLRVKDSLPVHERYGIVSFEQRLREDMPRYWVTENNPRRDALASYYAHREWIERYFEVEMVGRWDILENYRNYSVFLFRLTPREEEIEKGFELYGGTRPAAL